MPVTAMPDTWHFVAEVPDKESEDLFREWTTTLSEDLCLGGAIYRLASPITFSVKISRQGSKIKAHVRLVTSIETECSRCLLPLEVALDENFGYCYVSQPDDDESDEVDLSEDVMVVTRLGKTLDLSQSLWECLVVSMPPFPQCPEGCDSVGPFTTREEGEAADPRFQILADKFGSFSSKGGNLNGNSKE